MPEAKSFLYFSARRSEFVFCEEVVEFVPVVEPEGFVVLPVLVVPLLCDVVLFEFGFVVPLYEVVPFEFEPVVPLDEVVPFEFEPVVPLDEVVPFEFEPVVPLEEVVPFELEPVVPLEEVVPFEFEPVVPLFEPSAVVLSLSVLPLSVLSPCESVVTTYFDVETFSSVTTGESP